MAIRIADDTLLVTRDTPEGRVQTLEANPYQVRPLADVLAEHVAKVQADRERARWEAIEAQRDRDELARERDREWWAE